MKKHARQKYRLERAASPSISNWRAPTGPHLKRMRENAVLDCGWGRLLFGHTFATAKALTDSLLREERGRRDIALYIRDPHVVLAQAPDQLFLDPSHTFRLWFSEYRPARRGHPGFLIRPAQNPADLREVNRIYGSRGMVPLEGGAARRSALDRRRVLLVAEAADGRVVGSVMGVDHAETFDDPEGGSSLWCLAVDPQIAPPGVGEALVRHLAELFMARGRSFMDLSVMHDNVSAIGLYEKIGFQRVPVFCVKRKNPINERLFTPPARRTKLNPYAEIIIQEAQRRGIRVEVVDKDHAFFRLIFGARSVLCRESLTDLTPGTAVAVCDDKMLTRKWLKAADLKVPEGRLAGTKKENRAFLRRHRRLVVKPLRGEQGRGISVDVTKAMDLDTAIEKARREHPEVLLEKFTAGQDLRVVVIDYKTVAAAVRRPPIIVGTGQHTVRELIEKQSRRRRAATGGESSIPIDDECERTLRAQGLRLGKVVPAGKEVLVRKTANLHTGGTILDCTARLHPKLRQAAERAARALKIPVVGLDFLVPRVDRSRYVILEANERVGLANHEPQPTAERFIDLLFPQTASKEIPRP